MGDSLVKDIFDDSNNNNGNDSSFGTWREWARYVLIELKTLRRRIDNLELENTNSNKDLVDKISKASRELTAADILIRELINSEVALIKTDIAILKLRAGIWGAIGAAIPILLTLVVGLFVHYITK